MRFGPERSRKGRSLLRALLAIVGSIAVGIAPAQEAGTMPRLLAQRTLIAGLRHHAGPEVWRRLNAGDPVELVRESANPHDERAVRVDWHQITLGYVPRAGNDALAWALDQGIALQAHLVEITRSSARGAKLRLALEITLQ